MAIRIVNVEIKTGYKWQDIRQKADWATIKNINTYWRQPIQTSLPGELVQIMAEVSENNWNSIRDNHEDWQHIKGKFNSWLDVKNY